MLMRYYSFMRSASPLAPAELRGNRLWMRNYAISLRSWHNRKKLLREGEYAMKQEKAITTCRIVRVLRAVPGVPASVPGAQRILL